MSIHKNEATFLLTKFLPYLWAYIIRNLIHKICMDIHTLQNMYNLFLNKYHLFLKNTISDSHLLIQFLFMSEKNIMQNINLKELYLGIQLSFLNKTLWFSLISAFFRQHLLYHMWHLWKQNHINPFLCANKAWVLHFSKGKKILHFI